MVYTVAIVLGTSTARLNVLLRTNVPFGLTWHRFCRHITLCEKGNHGVPYFWWCAQGWQTASSDVIQCDSFGTRPKKMWISQRLFIRFWTCIYEYIPCFMKSMSMLEEMLEMFATTVQAELNATLHVCESGLQDVLTNRSNFTSNVIFQFVYGAWLVGISFSF